MCADAGSRPAPTREPTVLLAEDHAEVRALVSAALRRRGYQVIVANDGLHALEAARRAPGIDILITDLGMPGMGGLELAEALRAGDPRLPIIYFSGCLLDSVPAPGGPGTRQTFLTKPVSLITLLDIVDEMLAAAP